MSLYSQNSKDFKFEKYWIKKLNTVTLRDTVIWHYTIHKDKHKTKQQHSVRRGHLSNLNYANMYYF